MEVPEIFYDKIVNGESVPDATRPVLLNAREKRSAEYIEKQIKNALGYEVSITTLTTIMKRISEQKFFEVPPADYVPIRVGEGAWSSNLVTYLTYNQFDDFATGIVNTGAQNAKQAMVDVGVSTLSIPVYNWVKSIGWSIMDLEIAAKSGNWDLVTSKEKARKKAWDLGIQKVAFLGMSSTADCLGLFNQTGITTNTTTITSAVGGLTTTTLSTFFGQILQDYRKNCNRTAWPTHFVMPEFDYLQMALPTSPTYPIKSNLQLLLETLQTMTGNKNFKVLPSAYGDKTISSNNLTKNIYALYRYDEESLRMDIPVDYTSTLANSLDNFTFQNSAYAQLTGVLAYRPLEMLYYQY